MNEEITLQNRPMQERIRFDVAVFYLKGWERYGGIHSFDSEQEARAERESLLKAGYKHVHMWSVTTKLLQE